MSCRQLAVPNGYRRTIRKVMSGGKGKGTTKKICKKKAKENRIDVEGFTCTKRESCTSKKKKKKAFTMVLWMFIFFFNCFFLNLFFLKSTQWRSYKIVIHNCNNFNCSKNEMLTPFPLSEPFANDVILRTSCVHYICFFSQKRVTPPLLFFL